MEGGRKVEGKWEEGGRKVGIDGEGEGEKVKGASERCLRVMARVVDTSVTKHPIIIIMIISCHITEEGHKLMESPVGEGWLGRVSDTNNGCQESACLTLPNGVKYH